MLHCPRVARKELAVEVPRVPVDQNPAEVKYDNAAFRLLHRRFLTSLTILVVTRFYLLVQTAMLQATSYARRFVASEGTARRARDPRSPLDKAAPGVGPADLPQ
jgi:hypothetical protein